MYKNRINRTSTNLDLQSLIRRCDIAFDERARYVEFVCSIWNEGRFGPDLAEPVTVNQHDRPDLEPVSFLYLDDGRQGWPDGNSGSAACRALIILGRVTSQKIEVAFQQAPQKGFLPTPPLGSNSTSAASPNQGRGSP